MSQKLKCVNVIMKGIGRKDAKEAYAKFKFQLTRVVTDAFEWPDISGASEWEPEAPNDEFRCHFIELTPNSTELHAHAMKIEASTIGDFQIQKKAKKEGKNTIKAQKSVIDVLCTVRFTNPTALATLEYFKVNANKNSEMLIAYDAAPQQGEFDGTQVVAHTGEVIDGRQGSLAADMTVEELTEHNQLTHAKKVARKREESKKFADIRERSKNK